MTSFNNADLQTIASHRRVVLVTFIRFYLPEISCNHASIYENLDVKGPPVLTIAGLAHSFVLQDRSIEWSGQCLADLPVYSLQAGSMCPIQRLH